jgi:hypothetical protein
MVSSTEPGAGPAALLSSVMVTAPPDISSPMGSAWSNTVTLVRLKADGPELKESANGPNTDIGSDPLLMALRLL